MNPELKVQEAIIKKHMANDMPLLKKNCYSTVGSSGFDPETFSIMHVLSAWTNWESFPDVPYFTFSISSVWFTEIKNDNLLGTSMDNGLDIMVRSNCSGNPLKIRLPQPENLFTIRNWGAESPDDVPYLLNPGLAGEDVLPLEKSVSYFVFSALSESTYTQLCSTLEMNHPYAEEAIERYLSAVDKGMGRFRDSGKERRNALNFLKELDDVFLPYKD
ncbi:MAG: hypothetical protein ABIB71_08475 [Candidatus Woesearchaeota archaeon]